MNACCTFCQECHFDVCLWSWALPPPLVDGNPGHYQSARYGNTWDDWCRMWFGIMWVRYQAIEREAEARAWSEDL